jgi:hypothetical protein
MNVKGQLKSYEELEFSITLTAPVNDWRVLLKQLERIKQETGYYAWPVGGFVGAVSSMLSDLDKTHSGVVRKEDQAAFAVRGHVTAGMSENGVG